MLINNKDKHIKILQQINNFYFMQSLNPKKNINCIQPHPT